MRLTQITQVYGEPVTSLLMLLFIFRIRLQAPDAGVTCESSGQPDGTGMRVCPGVWFQQVAEDGVRDEVESIARNVPQDHGPRPSVQPLQALGPQDAADAVQRASVLVLAGHPHRAQRDVGAVGHVPGEVKVLWKDRKVLKVPAAIELTGLLLQIYLLEWSASAFGGGF